MTSRIFALILAAALPGAPALAQEAPHAAHHGAPAEAAPAADNLAFSGAFARATLPRAPVGGAYLTIANPGAEDDRLLSVTAPVGEAVEIHEMTNLEGVMTMRALPEGIAIPAGESVSLAPGGLHLMILGLTAPLKTGEILEMTLNFEHAGAVVVPFEVRAINARAEADPHGGHAGAHGPHPQDRGGD